MLLFYPAPGENLEFTTTLSSIPLSLLRMAESLELMIQEIKGIILTEINVPLRMLTSLLENSKWYFGHNVQVITFSSANYQQHVIVIPAHSTRASALDGSGNNDIHLCGNGSGLEQALNSVLWQLKIEIGRMYRVDEKSKTLSIDESNAPCNCQHGQPTPVMTEVNDMFRDFENRLQGLEKRLLDVTAPLEDRHAPGSPCSSSTQASTVQGIESVLQKIESKLEAIEQKLQRCTAERTHATLANNKSTRGVTSATDIWDHQPNLSANDEEHAITKTPGLLLGAQHQGPEWEPEPSRIECEPEPSKPKGEPGRPVPGPALKQSPSSPAYSIRFSRLPSSQYDINIEDLYCAADITPSDSPTERSVTPRVGPDEAVDLNRAVMREEINRTLAAAMISLAEGLLRSGRG